ncbi:MAG: cytochrome c [Verrucomicrobiota bacterium]
MAMVTGEKDVTSPAMMMRFRAIQVFGPILFGSFLLSGAVRGAEPVTFNQHVGPLVHQHCASCHRPGEVGPFPLIEYQDVAKKARTIASVVNRRYMPPWHPSEGHEAFAHNRRLSEKEIGQINQWIEGGKPEGEGDLTAPSFPEGWSLGTPDLVVSMSEAFPIPAEGADLYRNFAIPLNLEKDLWVKAVELRPSARGVVHHSLFFLDGSGEAVKKDGADGTPGFRGMGFRRIGSLGGYVPGTTVQMLPGDLAMPLPKDADLVLASHFHPSGKAEWEKSEVGLYLTETPPSRPLVSLQVPPGFGRSMGIDIPAGERDYRVRDEFELPVDVEAISVGGHAHYLCQEMKMTAQMPSGEERVLLLIEDWDLNWQDRYFFAESIRLPAGTVLTTELRYDNSEENPENPFFPPRRVRWGHESTDEMGSITLQVTPVHAEEEQALVRSSRRAQLDLLSNALRNPRETFALGLTRKMGEIDQNRDGIVQAEEIPSRYRARLLNQFDQDDSQALEEKERLALLEAVRNGEKVFR